MDTWNCRGWEAFHDRMPGGLAKLRVTGECEMDSPGYTLAFRKNEPQGINRKDLVLTLYVAEEPKGLQREVMTWTPATYEEETDMKYDTVSIVGVETGIPVQEISE